MIHMEIREDGCRGCQMCVDICPTRALEYDAETKKARVAVMEDCIACLSCKYLCPSGAIAHSGYDEVRNFYRDLDFTRRMERFL